MIDAGLVGNIFLDPFLFYPLMLNTTKMRTFAEISMSKLEGIIEKKSYVH